MVCRVNPYDDSGFVRVEDLQVVQETVLAAAIKGDLQVRSQLPALRSAFEEPYRTVADRIHEHLSESKFLDRHTLGAVLRGCCLMQRGAAGLLERVTAEQVLELILAQEPKPGQAGAYIELLRHRCQEKQVAEFAEQASEAVKAFSQEPEKLLAEIQQLTTSARYSRSAVDDDAPEELLEVIPYIAQLVHRQQGNEYLGLNSGFQHLNYLLNGLDTGLSVLAAPPGKGKTTFMMQLACQAAELNNVPVLFISMEQSKEELRAKALARLSKLEYRHILRGRLYADDAECLEKLLNAASRYAKLSRRLTIIEGDPSTTTEKISELASRKMAKASADRCLIIVDYLQILPVSTSNGPALTNTKDRIDFLVSALRRIARELNSPVWAISAENRAGYNKSNTMDVFKESGGIEYSADSAMVLVDGDWAKPASTDNYRPIDLNIVKNRNGERGAVRLKFYAKHAEFIESSRDELPQDSDG